MVNNKILKRLEIPLKFFVYKWDVCGNIGRVSEFTAFISGTILVFIVLNLNFQEKAFINIHIFHNKHYISHAIFDDVNKICIL